MKKTLTIAAIAATMSTLSASAQDLVAGWDTFNSAAAQSATFTISGGFAASYSNGLGSAGEGAASAGRGASTDGTWGSFDGNGTAPSTSASLQADNYLFSNADVTAGFDFTLDNSSGTFDIELGSFYADVLRWRPNAANAFTLTVLSGDITNGVVFTSAANALTSFGGAPLTGEQHDELAISFAALADHTLAIGESATIQIAFTGGTGTGGGHHLFVDNIGFSSVPEPSTYALLGGLFALSFVAMRRRK